MQWRYSSFSHQTSKGSFSKDWILSRDAFSCDSLKTVSPLDPPLPRYGRGRAGIAPLLHHGWVQCWMELSTRFSFGKSIKKCKCGKYTIACFPTAFRNIYLLQAGAHRWSNDADNSWGNKGQPNQDLIYPKKIPTKNWVFVFVLWWCTNVFCWGHVVQI